MGRYEKIHELESGLNGAELNIGIVMSRYNIDVSKGLLDSCTAELEKNGVLNIVMITVPGALEIPLALQKMALTDQFDALVALGAVVRGDTYHFEVVSKESKADALELLEKMKNVLLEELLQPSKFGLIPPKE